MCVYSIYDISFIPFHHTLSNVKMNNNNNNTNTRSSSSSSSSRSTNKSSEEMMWTVNKAVSSLLWPKFFLAPQFFFCRFCELYLSHIYCYNVYHFIVSFSLRSSNFIISHVTTAHTHTHTLYAHSRFRIDLIEINSFCDFHTPPKTFSIRLKAIVGQYIFI